MAGWRFRKPLFSGSASCPKLGTKQRVTLHKPRQDLSSVNDLGALSLPIESVVCDAISNRAER